MMVLVGKHVLKRDYREIDITKNIEIKFSGWNGAGNAEVIKNDIPFDQENEAASRFIESIDYVITPNGNLSNGDIVEVRVRFNDEYREMAGLKVLNEKKEYKVTGLVGEKVISKTEDSYIVDAEGNKKNDWQSIEIIDGIKIPSSWGLSDEEKQLYVEYQKKLAQDKNETGENDPAVIGWQQGENKNQTRRKTTSFWFEDYDKDEIKTYYAAIEYGKTSSQKYKVEPIMEDGEQKGFRTLFEEEEK